MVGCGTGAAVTRVASAARREMKDWKVGDIAGTKAQRGGVWSRRPCRRIAGAVVIYLNAPKFTLENQYQKKTLTGSGPRVAVHILVI